MELRFKIAGRIARPVEEVFEAVVDPDQLSQFFTTGGAKGRIETGATVTWDFADFPGAFPVEVVEVEPNRKIVLRWEAADGAQSTSDEADAGAGYVWELRGLGRRLVLLEGLARTRHQAPRRLLRLANHATGRPTRRDRLALLAPTCGFWRARRDSNPQPSDP